MLVDISDLLSRKKTQKEIDVSFQSNNITFEGEEIVFMEPVKITGTFNLSGDIINFHGYAKTKLGLVCSRCLEKFSKSVEIEINEKFSKFQHDGENDVIILNNDNVDFSSIIEINIILSLPMKILCSENCKGLCPVCGTNLNYSQCNCKENDIDTRLEKLREFFSNN